MVGRERNIRAGSGRCMFVGTTGIGEPCIAVGGATCAALTPAEPLDHHQFWSGSNFGGEAKQKCSRNDSNPSCFDVHDKALLGPERPMRWDRKTQLPRLVARQAVVDFVRRH